MGVYAFNVSKSGGLVANIHQPFFILDNTPILGMMLILQVAVILKKFIIGTFYFFSVYILVEERKNNREDQSER